jgi:hypothetical protein
VILQKMGLSKDEFVRDVGDLIAHEYVTREKVMVGELSAGCLSMV